MDPLTGTRTRTANGMDDLDNPVPFLSAVYISATCHSYQTFEREREGNT